MTTYFTADLHLGHGNILRYCNRPFADVDAMNAGIIARWNDTVGPDDTVWLLGDVVVGHIADTLPLVAQLNGTILLVPGNHDRCWPGNGPKSLPWIERYLAAGIEDVYRSGAWIDLAGQTVAMSHFPYEDIARHEGANTRFLPYDDGHWLLHGHIHDEWKVNGRQINVGQDVWDYTPVSEQQIAAIIGG